MLSKKLKYYKVESIARGSKMVQQRIQNASEALKRAKEMGEEIFLARYQKVPEILKEFFDNISDLIQYLRGNGYIKENTAEKWNGKIKQAYKYLEEKDIVAALEEIHTGIRGIQLVLDRIKSDAFWKNQKIPEQLRMRLDTLASSLREFLVILLDIVDYYANTYNVSPIVQASWSEKVNNTFFQIKNGDIIPALETIISIMRDLKPLLDEIKSKIN